MLRQGRVAMTPWHIIVADFDAAPHGAPEFRQRLLDAWSGPTPIEVKILPGEELEHADPSHVDAVVFRAPPDETAVDVLAQLSVLDDELIPTLAIVDRIPEGGHPYESTGAVVQVSDAGLDHITAILSGLLHRQRAVHRLRDEVSLAYRFHGGLEGEISRMHDELQLAAMVQREFLPRTLPSLCGVEFAALWRPAHYVSGDIYDVSRLDDDHIGVFLADAVGHGVPAALMTMVICRSLTTKLISGDRYTLLEPSEVLARLNHDLIRRQGRSTRFATGVYAIINCRSREMRLAIAGHPPPILQKADGTATELEVSGGLLGVFADETYEQIATTLDVDDRLLLYSDGFEQAFPGVEADEYERRLPTQRYREEFARFASAGTPAAVVEAIGRRLDEAQGSLHPIDDLTLVCMHAGPLPVDEPAQHEATRIIAT